MTNANFTLRLVEYLHKDVNDQVNLFDSLWPGFRDDGNVVSPHRQRTSINKLIGYALFLGVAKKGRSKQLIRPLEHLRAWQKELGPVRDVDVTRDLLMICRAEGNGTVLPAAAALDEALENFRADLMAPLRKKCNKRPGKLARRAIQDLHETLNARLDAIRKKPGKFDLEDAQSDVTKTWTSRLAALTDDHSNKSLHSFRVANKKLRFVTEIFAMAEEDDSESVYTGRAAILQDVHDILGHLSDLWVLGALIRQHRAQWAAEQRRLDQSIAALEEERRRIEAIEFDRWFQKWPVLQRGDFLSKAEVA